MSERQPVATRDTAERTAVVTSATVSDRHWMLMRRILGTVGIWPLLAFLAMFFAYPLAKVLLGSLHFPSVSFEEYWLVLTDEVFLRVLANTFHIAAGVTILCVLLGYPIALALVLASPAVRTIMFICILMPLLTSFLVRTYAWMVLLQRQGVINDVLMDLGLISTPLSLMYNRLGTFVGMTHVLLPFMILPLYSVMRGIDRSLLEAARNLGAPFHQVFLRIFLPLSLPGVAAGGIFVFMLSLGFYITPALLGGGADMTIAVLIERQATKLLNWPLASALASVLLVLSMILYIIYERLLGVDRIFGGIARR